MTHSFFFKLTIGESKESFKSFPTLLSLSKNEICMQTLTKRIRTNYLKKNTFFTSQKKNDLVNFSKNSNDTGPT